MYTCREFDNMYEKRGEAHARSKTRRQSADQEKEDPEESTPDAE